MQCPKCHYLRKPSDNHIHPDICPACGIAYQKWLARQQQTANTNHQTTAHETEEEHDAFESDDSWLTRLAVTFLEVPTSTDSTAFWSRLILLTALICWWGWIALHGIDWEIIGGSFMHNINLAFHEFGHVLFGPFGELMMFLGGSLFQVLLPLIPLAVFSFQQRDNFSASIMLAWCGQSFIDVAPYIRDAEYRALPLVGGATEANHDWGNILTMLDAVSSCYTLAKICFTLGVLIMCTGFFWGAYLLLLQYRVMNENSQQ